MKKILNLTLLSLLIISCGGNESLDAKVEEAIAAKDVMALKELNTEIEAQQNTLEELNKRVKTQLASQTTKENYTLITTKKVESDTFYHYLELQGDVKTKQNVLIFPEMSGKLENIYVKEGDKVTKGQLLANIDDGGLKQQVAQLESNLALAKTTYERQKRLWDQKIGSEIQFLQAKTDYESQVNGLAQLRKQLDKSSVRAPFAGIIDDVIQDEGTVVSPGPGSELFRIVNLENMYIETDVPESYIGAVEEGVNVEVYFPIIDKTINTVIKQAGNFINPTNRTFKILIDIKNIDKSIKPNLTAKLKINDYTNTSALLIPQSIISENANSEQYIYKFTNIEDKIGEAQKVLIETGKSQNDVIEVKEGIKSGDLLIDEGARSVKDGQKVKVVDSF